MFTDRTSAFTPKDRIFNADFPRIMFRVTVRQRKDIRLTGQSLLSEITKIYRNSLKPADSMFNIYLARPLAAILVAALAKTKITPNQVTLVSVLPMLIAVAAFVAIPGTSGLWAGVLAVEFAYIMDCADGQLARVTGRSSPIGGELDFLIDEIKAFLLIAALTIRWALEDGTGSAHPYWVGISTLALLGIALSLTKFVRTDVYAEATGLERNRHGQSVAEAHTRKTPLWPVLMVARFISQYPVCLPIFALLNRMDLFVWAYGVVHMLYAAQTTLGICVCLGRFDRVERHPDGGSE